MSYSESHHHMLCISRQQFLKIQGEPLVTAREKEYVLFKPVMEAQVCVFVCVLVHM